MEIICDVIVLSCCVLYEMVSNSVITTVKGTSVITDENNAMVNSQELIGTTEYVTV